MLTDRFPEVGWLESKMLGDRAGQSWPQQLFPATVQRFISAFGVTSFGADRMASSQMRAMQALDVAGLDPGPDATPMELQQYGDRVREWARILNIIDFGLYAGAPLPAGAGLRYEDLEIQSEFRQVVFESGMDISEGFAAFVAQNPDYTSWNVFTSGTTTGASIPQSQIGLEFLQENEELLMNLPHAAAWLTPPRSDDKDDLWSRRAGDQMYAMDLRRRFTPEEYLEEIYIKEAMPVYYGELERYEEGIYVADRRGDSEEADRLTLEMNTFKTRFLRMHPIFNDSLNRNSDRNRERREQRNTLLSMPREQLPEGEHVDIVLNLMTSYAQFEREMNVLKGQNSTAASEERQALRRSFYAWVNEYVAENPAADSYYQAVIRHDRILEGVETEFTYEFGS